MRVFYTYVLYSEVNNRHYIGSTEDARRRLKEHSAGETRSTKSGRPWILVYLERFETRSDAIKRENNIKRYKGGKAFKRLLESSTSSGIV